ncbi:hypothetical protein FQA39_LY05465 [Lamprigera yunnana]|nr:hypothetical protein FQA39_LY05465 [Lamprigera yunnana]
MVDHDFEMALQLQQQFDQEAKVENPTQNLVYTKVKRKHTVDETRSLTDPSWEVIDPTPDIHLLFMAFNGKFFWNKLLCVAVSWSKRMKRCAGTCSYQGHGGLCHITLSEPLLKLRPRKDLVETLLHEMIHAYLFVTDNNTDHDGHGPQFHKHMDRINQEAGTNITVYHDFHDEVRLYQQHWWRCNGPCQNLRPFLGIIRRCTNRAPGPNDRWWAEHQRTCSGTFIKIKEPEKALKKKPTKDMKPTSPKNDIRHFYPIQNQETNSKIKNVLTDSVAKPTTFVGSGHILEESATNDTPEYATVRNHWLNRFPEEKGLKRTNTDMPNSDIKRVKLNDTCTAVTAIVNCPNCQILVAEENINDHLDSCLNELVPDHCTIKKDFICPVCDKLVVNNTINDHLNECIRNIFCETSNENDDVYIISDSEDIDSDSILGKIFSEPF